MQSKRATSQKANKAGKTRGADEAENTTIASEQPLKAHARKATSRQGKSEATPTQRHRKSSGAAPAEVIAATPESAIASETLVPQVAMQAQVVRQREASAGDIARLAYSFWQARGHQHGSPEQDWLRAERQLALVD